MSTTTIRLSIGNDFEKILRELQAEYPLLEYPEIIRMAVSGYYIGKKTEQRNNLRQQLMTMTPTETLSDETEREVAAAEAELASGKPAPRSFAGEEEVLKTLEQ